jgi:hypothetical protein
MASREVEVAVAGNSAVASRPAVAAGAVVSGSAAAVNPAVASGSAAAAAGAGAVVVVVVVVLLLLLLLLLPVVVVVVVLWGSILLLPSQPICASTSELKPMRSIRSHTGYCFLLAVGNSIALLYCFCNFISCASIFCTLINTITVPSAPSVLLVMGSFEDPAL